MKYILLSDIHFGYNSNSDEFNNYCLKFLDYVLEYIENNNIDVSGCVFLGDWFHTRNAINVKTLKYGVEGIYKLGNIGNGNTFMLLGNHDLFFKDRRDVSSIVVPEGDIGVEVIDEPIMVNNMLLCPWLIGDEKLTDLISKYNPTYVLGHFEIPSFSLNKVSKFEGDFNPNDYKGPKRIISGHFHCRDEKGNITYMGNCFSHNFADVNDWHNKGFAIFDTDTNDLEYIEWADAPKFCVARISKLNEIEFGSNMVLKLINDVNLKPTQLTQLKEELEKLPYINDCFVYPNELDIAKTTNNKVDLENIIDINSLIITLLSDLDMNNIDNNKLIKIFNNIEN